MLMELVTGIAVVLLVILAVKLKVEVPTLEALIVIDGGDPLSVAVAELPVPQLLSHV